jgi:epoxyqueuosine reductase QueG
MTNLSQEIVKLLSTDSIDFYGIGYLSNDSERLTEYGYPLAGEYSRTVSIGLALSNRIVDMLTFDPPFPAVELYRHFCYDVVNRRIDGMLLRIADFLSRKGYESLPVPATGVTDKSRLFGTFSHKAAARLSGLGWIGKSSLLINGSVGPRARWGTVLTNAPLAPTGKPSDQQCGTCDVCVIKCPAHAFTGTEFRVGDDREVRYDAFACDEYLTAREKATGYRVCGICVKVCPFGGGSNQFLEIF